MPMWLAPGSQCVAPEAAANPLNLTLPGIPESDNIFELYRRTPATAAASPPGGRHPGHARRVRPFLLVVSRPGSADHRGRHAAGGGQRKAGRRIGTLPGRPEARYRRPRPRPDRQANASAEQPRAGPRRRPAELEIVRRPAGRGRLCHGLGLRAAGDDAAAEAGTGGLGSGHERPRFAGGHPRHVVLPGLALVLGPGRSDRGHARPRRTVCRAATSKTSS